MSENLSTANIPSLGAGVPKTLQPGNQICTVHSIELKPFTYKPGAYEIILNIEGPDLGPNFQGFFIDKNNENLGRNKGQVGRVKATEWAFNDGETKSKIKISRDTEIMKWLNSFCEAIGKKEWMAAQDFKHANIESLMNAFNLDKPFEGFYINFCIAGKEYMSNGYKNYDLFLPKFTKEGVPFELAGTTKSKVVIFDENKHIIRKKVETITTFAADDTISDTTISSGVVSSIKDDFVL
jgi:hypothetical protein